MAAVERERVVRQAVETALATRAEADVSWLGPAHLSSGWALAPGTLGFLSQLLALLRPRHVLELGAGASTRVLAQAASRRQPRGYVSSIDHDPTFVAEAVRHLAEDGTAGVVRVQFAPLVVRRRFGTSVPVYRWNRAAFRSRGPADVVLIDGPPRLLGGRQGTLYQVLEVSRQGTVILLDDASRSEEQMVLARWEKDFGAAIDVQLLPGLEKGVAAVLVCDLGAIIERCREDEERQRDRTARSADVPSQGEGETPRRGVRRTTRGRDASSRRPFAQVLR